MRVENVAEIKGRLNDVLLHLDTDTHRIASDILHFTTSRLQLVVSSEISYWKAY